MCRATFEGGRRCPNPAAPHAKRGYARAKYAADQAVGASPAAAPGTTPAPAPAPAIVVDPQAQALRSLRATWGDRAEEIAALADQVPTTEDLTEFIETHTGSYTEVEIGDLRKRLAKNPGYQPTAEENFALRVAALYEMQVNEDLATVDFEVHEITVDGDTGDIVISGSAVRRKRHATTTNTRTAKPPSRGTSVAHFRQTLTPHKDGPETHWEATSDMVAINKAAQQGKGLGAQFTRHSENALIAAGITRVNLFASMQVGGYAWARAGYDWDPTQALDDEHRSNPSGPFFMFDDSPITRLEAHITAHGDPTATLQPVLDRLRAHASVGPRPDDYPTPMEVAMLGWTEGAETWPGKQIMLGSRWYGTKNLVPPA